MTNRHLWSAALEKRKHAHARADEPEERSDRQRNHALRFLEQGQEEQDQADRGLGQT